MRAFLSSIFTAVLLISGSAIPGYSHAAPAPRVYTKSNLLVVLRDWEQALNDRAMDAFERDLEREFILRLRFQVERRYTGDDASLIRILAFMLELEEQPQNMSLSYTTNYLRELLETIRTIREPNENLVRFIRQFTEASGIKNVMTADQFLRSRAYLNGYQTATARDMTDDVWNEVAARITTLDDDEATSAPVEVAQTASQEALDRYEQVRLIGPGMPHDDPVMKSTSAAALVSADSIDPELLAELQQSNDITPEELAVENESESIPNAPAAPRTQSIRSTDDSALLR